MTNDAALAEKVDILRRQGGKKKYQAEVLGFNSRLDTLQAAVLTVKLGKLDEWNASRRAVAARYDELIGPPYVTPAVADYAEPVYHLYVVRCPDREATAAKLREAGVDSGLHYPVPIHLQEAYKYLGHQLGDFAEAEKACAQVLSLPMFPYMRDEEVEAVARALP